MTVKENAADGPSRGMAAFFVSGKNFRSFRRCRESFIARERMMSERSFWGTFGSPTGGKPGQYPPGRIRKTGSFFLQIFFQFFIGTLPHARIVVFQKIGEHLLRFLVHVADDNVAF